MKSKNLALFTRRGKKNREINCIIFLFLEHCADLNTNEAKATTNHYTSVKLNELIVAEHDSECLELLLKLIVTEHQGGLHENLNALEAEALLAFLINKAMKKHEDQGQQDYCCLGNERILALCIQTCGVIMSSFQCDVPSKVNNEYISTLHK